MIFWVWDFIKLCLPSDFFCSKTLNGFLGGVQFVKSIKSFHLALIVSIVFQTTFIWVWILIYLWQLYMNSCWLRLIFSFDKLGRYVTLNSFTIKFKYKYIYTFHCQYTWKNDFYFFKLKCSWKTSYIYPYVKNRYLYEFFTDVTVLYNILWALRITHSLHYMYLWPFQHHYR